MSLTAEQKRLHDELDSADYVIYAAIDDAFYAAQRTLAEQGFDTANDDRAEELAVAIYKYFLDSAVPDKEPA